MTSDDAQEKWIELRLLVPIPDGMHWDGEDTEGLLAPLTRLILEQSPGGYLTEGWETPAGDLPVPEQGTVRLRFYVESDRLETVRDALLGALDAWPAATLSVATLDPDWRERWKRWFHAFRVSPTLAVRPCWEEPQELLGTDGIEVVIEPGMAFGTGQHETTKLCLAALEPICRDSKGPNRLLDVGCGTGILAIAAALLGLESVCGMDIDPVAIECARENVVRNGVADRVELYSASLDDMGLQYPIVVANILAGILNDMAPTLVMKVEQGGRLLLSGILKEQSATIIQRFQALGMRFVSEQSDGSWVLQQYVRPA
jgi:ribosomal protein L11 methyltransferase